MLMIEILLGGLVLLFLILVFVLALIEKTTDWLPKWFCDHMGWHKTPEEVDFDGCSLGGTCPRCKRKVLSDSNGDYFASGS